MQMKLPCRVFVTSTFQTLCDLAPTYASCNSLKPNCLNVNKDVHVCSFVQVLVFYFIRDVTINKEYEGYLDGQMNQTK